MGAQGGSTDQGVVAIREVESRGKGRGGGAGPHPVGQEEAGEGKGGVRRRRL